MTNGLIDPPELDVQVVDAARLSRAAEDAAWLVERGYRAGAVGEFVAVERGLTERERQLLGWSVRLHGGHKHHIARELDAEDVAKRMLRVDADNVLAVIAAAEGGELLLESPAGLLCDPTWSRVDGRDLTANIDRALQLAVSALTPLRPSAVHWVFDQKARHAERLSAAIEAMPKSKRTKHLAEPVADPVATLEGGIVVSSDPALLDDCRAWLNLTALAVAPLGVHPLRL